MEKSNRTTLLSGMMVADGQDGIKRVCLQLFVTQLDLSSCNCYHCRFCLCTIRAQVRYFRSIQRGKNHENEKCKKKIVFIQDRSQYTKAQLFGTARLLHLLKIKEFLNSYTCLDWRGTFGVSVIVLFFFSLLFFDFVIIFKNATNFWNWQNLWKPTHLESNPSSEVGSLAHPST